MHLRPFQLSGPGPTVFRVRRGKPRCHIRKLILDLLISPKSLTMRMIIKPPFRISWVCDWNLRESWKWLRSYLTKVRCFKYCTLFTQGVTDDVTVIGHSWDTGKFLFWSKKKSLYLLELQVCWKLTICFRFFIACRCCEENTRSRILPKKVRESSS